MSRKAFEEWCEIILKDNPNWRESGDAELGWQAWQAASVASLERAVKEINRVDSEEWFKSQSAFGFACGNAIRALKDKP